MKISATIPSQKSLEMLDELRTIVDDDAPPSPTKTNKTRCTTKSIGDEIVDKGLDTWTRYEVMDKSVRRRGSLGKPIEEATRSWDLSTLKRDKPF